MAINKKKTFTDNEIAAATGLAKSTIRHRRKNLGMMGSKNEPIQGITYEQVQQVLNYKNHRMRKSNSQNIEELRTALMLDGFQYKKKEPIK